MRAEVGILSMNREPRTSQAEAAAIPRRVYPQRHRRRGMAETARTHRLFRLNSPGMAQRAQPERIPAAVAEATAETAVLLPMAREAEAATVLQAVPAVHSAAAEAAAGVDAAVPDTMAAEAAAVTASPVQADRVRQQRPASDQTPDQTAVMRLAAAVHRTPRATKPGMAAAGLSSSHIM